MMLGMMGERPLLVSSIIAHAAKYHADTEVVSRTTEGPIHRYTYAEAERRAKRLARALMRLGIAPGDRVATLAWNNYRHFELYYGISGDRRRLPYDQPAAVRRADRLYRQSLGRSAPVHRIDLRPAR
jgi:long-subunit acyl-CoA synthetase (AMP-forming)